MGISDDIKPRKYRRIVELAEIEERKRESKTTHGFFSENLSTDNDDFFDGTPIKNNKKKIHRKKRAKYNQPEKEGKQHLIYTSVIVFVVVFLIGIIVWQNFSTIKSFFDGSTKEANDKSLNEILNVSSNTIKKSDEVIKNEDEQPRSDESDEEKTEPTINKSAISISVLNGSGIKLAAKELSDVLTSNGFTIKYLGNAKSFNYQQTIIYYKSGKEAEANLIKSSIESSYDTVMTESDATVGNLYDLVIVAGKN